MFCIPWFVHLNIGMLPQYTVTNYFIVLGGKHITFGYLLKLILSLSHSSFILGCHWLKKSISQGLRLVCLIGVLLDNLFSLVSSHLSFLLRAIYFLDQSQFIYLFIFSKKTTIRSRQNPLLCRLNNLNSTFLHRRGSPELWCFFVTLLWIVLWDQCLCLHWDALR